MTSILNIKQQVGKTVKIKYGFGSGGFVTAVQVEGQMVDPKQASCALTQTDNCQALGVFTPGRKEVFIVGPFTVPVEFLTEFGNASPITVISSRIEAVRDAIKKYLSVTSAVEMEISIPTESAIDFSVMNTQKDLRN